ncbi:P-loop containing nucleoside triphosphate hydrolase protein [Colletotrichum phormii]|uniref:Vesicular-fusion protein SEC18 n=1 Tax=Colletotrichum phormii TaxID=359342 RepID=A0AAI9ZZE1_9PEZI|nr:P-loop containing nucleoside triphosphate hydrolase protein [Colletotrichum phormii]KAK1640671.1 P-loop containing nucleoside triphosphate hydrolase protein [Colletotrichum phormii]
MNVSWPPIEGAKRAVGPLDSTTLTELTKKELHGHVLARNQQILLRIEKDHIKYPIVLRVVDLKAYVVGQTRPEREDQDFHHEHTNGLFSQETISRFVSNTIKIDAYVSFPKVEVNIRDDVLPEEFGIGGLGPEFQTILRRALASRQIPKTEFMKLGIKHVRGILLHGPSGTGKTLIARKISQMLGVHKPKIINGPEIMNSFVGKSEENMRDIFAEAQDDDIKLGMESKLHLVIFDELDAICKSRGSEGGGGARVNDNMVNQLLAILDGVN